jgi:pyridoxal phosphate enzyme (YggS family)
MTDIATIISDNVARVRERMAAAAEKSGRDREAVTLVAVSKYVDVDEVRALVAAGCHDLGESRPQQLWQKADALRGEPIRWHMVGHLQRNKTRRTVPLISLLHSCDSPRLAAAVAGEVGDSGQPVPILIEVNVSGDAAKHGFVPNEVEPAIVQLASLSGIQLRGLMAMAAWGTTGDTARRDFASLRELRDRLQRVAPSGVRLDELSMGMSGDFEEAIEEGATLVRVGSLLFEGLGR